MPKHSGPRSNQRHSKKIQPLPEKLERHLSAYALAATAGMVLFGGQPAAANTIVYNNTTQTLIGPGTLSTPVGTFTITPHIYHRTYAGRVVVSDFSVLSGPFAQSYPLSRGARIGPGATVPPQPTVCWYSPQCMMTALRYASYNVGSGPDTYGRFGGLRGRWADATGFAPLIFGSNYGWAELAIFTTSPGALSPNIEVQLLGFAYNRIPNAPIFAGQTSNQSVPEPSTLALLALGAAGLPFWRRGKATKAKQ